MDLTGEQGSLAVVRDGSTVAEETIVSTDGFSHLVFDCIRDLLQEANVSLDAIDCYASASGPGSFTGVRIGLATVKGLAEAAGKPAIGVSNLRALAGAGQGVLRVPVLDARRGDVFAAAFDAHGDIAIPESVGPLHVFLAHLKNCADARFVTRDEPWLRTALATTAYGGADICQASASLAQSVALCAASDLEKGHPNDPASLDANYVRRSDAENFWSDRSAT